MVWPRLSREVSVYTYKVLKAGVKNASGRLRIGDVFSQPNPVPQDLIQFGYVLPTSDVDSVGVGVAGGTDEQPRRRGRPPKAKAVRDGD